MGPEEIEREMKRESEEIVSKERVERGGEGVRVRTRKCQRAKKERQIEMQ